MNSTHNIKHQIKMDSLKLDSDFALHSIHDGFAVNVDAEIQGFKPFSKYFRSDFFQIILFKSGETDISLNLTNYQITTDELIVCAPFDLKKVNSYNNSKHSTILFTSDFLEKAGLSKTAPEVMPFFTNQYSPHWKLDAEAATKINSLVNELQERQNAIFSNKYGKELLYLSFNIFLYELALIGNKYADTAKHISRKENLVVNFTSLVRIHFRKQRSLSFYSSSLSITPKYLTTAVKEITGKSAGKIVDGFVVQEARMLLDNPDLSIAQISEELNFSDQSFFGKFFKRNTGVSPSEYRKI